MLWVCFWLAAFLRCLSNAYLNSTAPCPRNLLLQWSAHFFPHSTPVWSPWCLPSSPPPARTDRKERKKNSEPRRTQRIESGSENPALQRRDAINLQHSRNFSQRRRRSLAWRFLKVVRAETTALLLMSAINIFLWGHHFLPAKFGNILTSGKFKYFKYFFSHFNRKTLGIHVPHVELPVERMQTERKAVQSHNRLQDDSRHSQKDK